MRSRIPHQWNRVKLWPKIRGPDIEEKKIVLENLFQVSLKKRQSTHKDRDCNKFSHILHEFFARIFPTGTHQSFPTGSSLSSPDRAPGLGHLSALPRRRRDGRASGVPVSSPRSRQEGHLARRHLHYRPATPLELPGMDWGGDPPPDREWERERSFEAMDVCL